MFWDVLGGVWGVFLRFRIIWDVLGHIGIFFLFLFGSILDVLGYFGTFWDVLRRFETFWDVLGHLGRFVMFLDMRPKLAKSSDK